MKNTHAKQHRILWADDDPEDLQFFRDVLSGITHNYEIIEVTNGKEVLDELKSSKAEDYPCLIILDINMPLLNGRDTLSILKSQDRYRSIPVVVFSTSNSESDKMFCRRYDTELVTKPPTYAALKQLIPKFLDICRHQPVEQ